MAAACSICVEIGELIGGVGEFACRPIGACGPDFEPLFWNHENGYQIGNSLNLRKCVVNFCDARPGEGDQIVLGNPK